MGIAAYNRGTNLVHRQIDEKKKRSLNMEVLKAINELPRGKAILFGPTVVRVLNGHWLLMNRKDGGFASHCYEYKTLRSLFAQWNAYVTGCGHDEHSFYYTVEPAKETSR